MIYFAHRGDSSNYPENTMLAFKKAIENGAKAMELDVHKTKDNKLVIIHDEDIQRTYLGKGLVKDYTLEELKQFPCRKDLFRREEACSIPTLEEVLGLIKGHDVMLNIELKTDCIHYDGIEEDVLKMLYNNQLQNQILISSFNHKSLEIVRSIDSDIQIGVLFDQPVQDIAKYVKSLKANAIHPRVQSASVQMIKEAHEEGLAINVYTVNDPNHIKRCLKEGIDGIFTDYPQLCKEILEVK